MERREREEKTRKIRSDKKINVNPAISQNTHDKLKMLAISCEVTKTHLAEKLLTYCLNNPDIVNYFQNQMNKDSNYRVIPTRMNGEVVYLHHKE